MLVITNHCSNSRQLHMSRHISCWWQRVFLFLLIIDTHHSTHQCNFFSPLSNTSDSQLWCSGYMVVRTENADFLWVFFCLLLILNFVLVSCYQHLLHATAWTEFNSFICGDFHTLIGWLESIWKPKAIILQLLKTCICGQIIKFANSLR